MFSLNSTTLKVKLQNFRKKRNEPTIVLSVEHVLFKSRNDSINKCYPIIQIRKMRHKKAHTASK